MKDFVAILFSEYFKSIREQQSLRKVSKLLHIFLTSHDEVEKCVHSDFSDNCIHRYNVEILNIFDSELQLINTKPMIKNKLNKLLSEVRKLKVQTILVLEYKKRNDCRIFHSYAKLTKHLNPCIKAL